MPSSNAIKKCVKCPNLSREEHGYILAEKSFVDRKPRTAYRATEKGRAAFLAYVEGMERLLRLAGRGEPPPGGTPG